MTDTGQQAPQDSGHEESSSALRYVAKGDNHISEWLGALMMVALSIGLFAVLKGWLDFAGGILIHRITVPYILAVAVFPVVYRQQEKIALIRPSGGRTGFWYSILDGLVSVSAAGLATIIFASVFVAATPIEKVIPSSWSSCRLIFSAICGYDMRSVRRSPVRSAKHSSMLYSSTSGV